MTAKTHLRRRVRKECEWNPTQPDEERRCIYKKNEKKLRLIKKEGAYTFSYKRNYIFLFD